MNQSARAHAAARPSAEAAATGASAAGGASRGRSRNAAAPRTARARTTPIVPFVPSPAACGSNGNSGLGITPVNANT